MAVQFHETKKIELVKPTLVEGFPGLGLVGTIAASFLVEKLKMEQVGYITSDQFPPLSAVHNYTALHPARIYASKKHNLIVVLSEFVVPMNAIYDLTDKLVEFSKQKKVSRTIALGGITIKGEQDTVYAIASSPELGKQISKIKTVELIKEGATTGISGVLLARATIEEFPVISLLAEAHPEYMDPRAAAMVLEVLKDILRIDFETAELDKEAKIIEEKMRDIMGKAKVAQTNYSKAESDGTGGGLGPMYG